MSLCSITPFRSARRLQPLSRLEERRAEGASPIDSTLHMPRSDLRRARRTSSNDCYLLTSAKTRRRSIDAAAFATCLLYQYIPWKSDLLLSSRQPRTLHARTMLEVIRTLLGVLLGLV
eukprot:6178408-Pleurochrysis_carterae.AAC.1